MPTGAKLIGALTFMALAYFISDLIKPLLPEGTNVSRLSEINAAVGFVMGWTVMGNGAGVTYRQSFGYGFTTLAATVFWCLLIWSGHEMLQRSVKMYYDGPVEALQEMGVLYVEYARTAAVQEVLLAAAFGALFVSWLTEYFARRWS